jgi:hypothetical protein
MNRRKPISMIVSFAVMLILGLVLTACATTQGEMPDPPANGPEGMPPGGPMGGGPGGPVQEEEAPYKLIEISMEMEAGASFFKAWPSGGKTIHAGVGWLHPFGRGEYVAGMGYPEAEAYPPPSYFNEEWNSTYKTDLFCIYRLEDGDIYAYDGIAGALVPELEDGSDGRIDYLINVIVGDTGAYEGATGVLLGRTPGRGANQEVEGGPALPASILKLMEGYIKIPEK